MSIIYNYHFQEEKVRKAVTELLKSGADPGGGWGG